MALALHSQERGILPLVQPALQSLFTELTFGLIQYGGLSNWSAFVVIPCSLGVINDHVQRRTRTNALGARAAASPQAFLGAKDLAIPAVESAGSPGCIMTKTFSIQKTMFLNY